jgi:hypothetical protein
VDDHQLDGDPRPGVLASITLVALGIAKVALPACHLLILRPAGMLMV